MRMRKTRLLRLEIWSSVALALLFQAAFLFELHSLLPSDLALWSLSILSVACVAVALLGRRSLVADAKISYAPERVCPQRCNDAEKCYRVLGTYCVILCRQPLFPMHYPRTKSFYLSEASADRAVVIASIENPRWRPIGVEPPNLSARMPQSERSHSASHISDVA
jgi:hypothetical protein